MGIEGDRKDVELALYWMLLELAQAEDPGAKLRSIVEHLVAATRAQRGFLQLYVAEDRVEPRWMLSQGCSEEEERSIRAVTSRGIVAAALASGETVHTPFALLDDRFANQPSVQDQRIEAALCMRLGSVGPGVLYLEGKRGAGPFADEDIQLAERIARHLGPTLERVARLEDRQRVDPTKPYRARLRISAIAGRSAALAHVFEQLEPFAPMNVTVLIGGAVGTGKSHLARAIHDNSPRRNGPFVELNCAAIPEGLIESELFGTMPGAFPGARRTPGKVEAAEGGTLFLDEIAEIPLAAQAKLLQLLETRQYYALASNKLMTANIRFIAATNADLAAMVDAKRFRQDLFSRINVIRIRMPSLFERREDIGLLAEELIKRVAPEHQLPALPVSERLRAHLEAGDWPGNVRELRHRIEGALIRAAAEGAPQIEIRHLAEAPEAPGKAWTFHAATRQFQRDFLQRELALAGWNVTALAEKLDLTRSHVYNLIHQFDLKRTDKKEGEDNDSRRR